MPEVAASEIVSEETRRKATTEFRTDAGREIYALAQIMRASSEKLGGQSPTGDRVNRAALQLLFDEISEEAA